MTLSLESLRGDAYALLDPDAERQLHDAYVRGQRPLARRELLGELLAAGAFLAAATAMLVLLPWQRPLDVPLALVLLVAYAVASRVQFELGPCFTVPTQLFLVPMLFALHSPAF